MTQEQAPQQMDDRAAALLEQLRQMLESAGEFVADQAPPMAQEVIAYGRAVHTASAIGLVLLAVVAAVALKCNHKSWREWSKNAELPHLGYFATILPMSLCPIFVGHHLLLAAKAWLAPRVYVLEYIRSML